MKRKGLDYPETVVLEVAKKVRDNALPNVAGLQRFGIGMPEISVFSADIVAAEALTSQGVNIQQQKATTVDKDKALVEAFIWAGDLGERVKQTFKKDTPEFVEYPFRLLEEARQSERNLMPALEGALAYGEKFMLQLTPAGHSPEIQAEGLTKLAALRDKDETQETKKESNKSQTQIRFEKFDGLIKTVNKITSAGRKAFRNEPGVLILFQSPWPKRPKAAPEPPAQ